MFAITGITGNVGGEVARNLLAAGQPVRAVVRDLTKGETWSKSGCSLAAADIDDAVAMTAAFKGSEGVFVVVPPTFDPLGNQKLACGKSSLALDSVFGSRHRDVAPDDCQFGWLRGSRNSQRQNTFWLRRPATIRIV